MARSPETGCGALGLDFAGREAEEGERVKGKGMEGLGKGEGDRSMAVGGEEQLEPKKLALARNCRRAREREKGEKGLGASSPRRAAPVAAERRRNTAEGEIDGGGAEQSLLGGAATEQRGGERGSGAPFKGQEREWCGRY